MRASIENTANKVSPKQALGVFFIALSLFIAFGGHIRLFTSASSWTGAVTGGGIEYTVKDPQHQPIEGVEGVLESIRYMDQNVTLNAPIDPSNSEGVMHCYVSLNARIRVRFTHPGYEPAIDFDFISHGEQATETVYMEPIETSNSTEPTTPSNSTEPVETPSNPDNSTIPTNPSGDIDTDTGKVTTHLGLTRSNLIYATAPALLGLGLIFLDIGERRE